MGDTTQTPWVRYETRIQTRTGPGGQTQYRATGIRRHTWSNPTTGPFRTSLTAARADRAADERRTAHRRSGYESFDPPHKTPLVGEYIEHYLDASEATGATLRTHQSTLKRTRLATTKQGFSWLLDGLTIGQLDYEAAVRLKRDLESYRVERGPGRRALEGYAPSVINMSLNLVRSAHAYAMLRHRVIPVTQQFKWPTLGRQDSLVFEYDPMDFPRLLAAARPRLTAPIYVAGHTGMRASEVCGLTIEALPALQRSDGVWYVDPAARQRLIVDHQLRFDYRTPPQLARVKTSASKASIPLRAEHCEVIADHLNAYGPGMQLQDSTGQPRTLVFGQAMERRAHYNLMAYKQFWRGVSDASHEGIGKHLKPHDLRHLFACVALANGVDLAQVSRLMRHKNTQITAKAYLHAFEAYTDDASNVVGDVYERLRAELQDTGTEGAVVISMQRPTRPKL